jgi:hypothetical protein
MPKSRLRLRNFATFRALSSRKPRSESMGIFDFLLRPKVRDPDDVQPPASKAGAGPDIDRGRAKTRTEKDLRRVQDQYDPDTDSFQGGGKR